MSLVSFESCRLRRKYLELDDAITGFMSFRELYASSSAVFSGYQRDFDEADYVILGVPFDVTSTYRTGARFAPTAIREASLNIETYSFRSNSDIEELKVHDLGDLHVTGDAPETLKRLEKVTSELLKAKKTPVLMGGEHTITLGSTRAVGRNFALVDFDAHLDLRNEYMNQRISHTTFMRRINEEVKPAKIVEIGTRAVCKEELEYAGEAGIRFFTAQQIREDGIKQTSKKVRNLLANVDRVYVTVDLDALDPAFAPGVQNPEPNGLTASEFFDLLFDVCDKRIIAFDVLEVTPAYDNGTTAVLAAKTIFEILCSLDKSRKRIQ